MRNLILFACFFNFFINPVFAEFQTSEILEKIKNGRAAIYSSLDLTSEQTHEINELDRIFYEKLYPELQEMSMLSQKLERIASSSDCTIKKVKSVRKEFKVVERNLNLLKKDYEKQIGGILTAGQTVEYRVLKKKQQEDMKNRMKEEIEAIKREQSRM
ncbi:MAG: hypothetical protein BHW62_05010 [Acinetobacter sp. CAG:196_36_41]|jgi:hypothetical protein|nr:MAG: hypothetical protein BHW62_05010 [Acinetobacter sp. CAG:196_36_41]